MRDKSTRMSGGHLNPPGHRHVPASGKPRLAAALAMLQILDFLFLEIAITPRHRTVGPEDKGCSLSLRAALPPSKFCWTCHPVSCKR